MSSSTRHKTPARSFVQLLQQTQCVLFWSGMAARMITDLVFKCVLVFTCGPSAYKLSLTCLCAQIYSVLTNFSKFPVLTVRF